MGGRTAASPPDGGWLAWSQVLGAFFMSMCSLGLANAWGIFQSHYTIVLLPSHPPSSIAWIGTTQGFLVNVIGLVSGRLYDAGQLRPCLILGTVLNVVGLTAASFSGSSYGASFASLGVCVGIGSGLFYVPGMAVVATWFEKKRPLATGVAATGASLGGVLYPVVFRAVVDKHGFGWACRGFAGVNAVLLGLACVIARTRGVGLEVGGSDGGGSGVGNGEGENGAGEKKKTGRGGSARRLLDPTAFRDIRFFLFSTALFLLWLGVDVPFFFLPSFVQQRLGLPAEVGDYLLAGMNAASVFGRLLLGFLAIYVGSAGVWQASIGASCALLACWAVVADLPAIVVFVALYGFFTGAVISLFPPVLLALTPDLSLVGTRLGMSCVFAGVGFLVGPPIASAVQKTPAGYVAEGAFAAGAYLAAFVVMASVLWLHKKRTFTQAELGEKLAASTSTVQVLVLADEKEPAGQLGECPKLPELGQGPRWSCRF